MLYAASLSKIAIAPGVFVEIERRVIQFDSKTRSQLIRMIRLLEEIFGSPAINHKFVKGLQGRQDVAIYRKSGTWRTFHFDSAVISRGNLIYIVVYIDNHPEASRGAVSGIRIVDDLMIEHAKRK